MAGNYDRIRKSSEFVRSVINNTYSANQKTDPSFDNSRLATIFNSLISSRETMISSFKVLSLRRTDLFSTLISAYYDSFYSRIIKLNGGFIFSLFAIIDIVGTEEFIRNFEKLIFLKQNDEINSNVKSLDLNYEQSLYFEEKFQEISNLSFPESTIFFEEVEEEWVLKKDNLVVSNQDIEENQIYGILYILGLLKNAYSETISSDNLIARKENFTRRTDGYIETVIKGISALYLPEIRNAIESKKYIDAYRKNEDSTYTDKYTLELDNLFSEINEVLVSFTDLSIEKIAALKQSGIYQKLPALINDIDESIRSLLDDILESIYVIDPFIENYSPFIEPPRNETAKFQSGTRIIEEARQAISPIFESFVDPFGGTLVSKSFSQWLKEVLDGEKINGNIFQLFTLYVGINMKAYVDEDFGKKLSEHSFVNLFRKNLIDPSLLEDDFKNKKETERALAVDNQIRVVQRPQNDMIPYSLKLNFPDLEILDYMSFSEMLTIGSPAETTFRKNVRLLIIESLAKDKENINRSILKVMEIIRDSAKENLKTLYVEICLKEALQSIHDFVESLANNETIISSTVMDELENFLAETSQTTTIISNYLSVWNSFYSQEVDIIDLAVKAGDFKDILGY